MKATHSQCCYIRTSRCWKRLHERLRNEDIRELWCELVQEEFWWIVPRISFSILNRKSSVLYCIAKRLQHSVQSRVSTVDYTVGCVWINNGSNLIWIKAKMTGKMNSIYACWAIIECPMDAVIGITSAPKSLFSWQYMHILHAHTWYYVCMRI